MSAYVLRPSFADTFVPCTGAVRMAQRYPQAEDQPEAIEGVAAHWAATEPLRTNVEVRYGQVAPNGTQITDEMIAGAAMYQSVVRRLIAHPVVERTLPAPDIHPECGGTPDTYGWGFEAWTLHIVDYKYGHGFVDAFENWQALCYVSAAVSEALAAGTITPEDESRIIVVITIVQPRNYHPSGPVRTWRVSLIELRSYFNILRHSAAVALSDKATTQVGDYCLYCPANYACTTLHASAQRIVDLSGVPLPFDMTPAQLSHLLRIYEQAKDALDAAIAGLAEQGLSMLRAGKALPFHASEYGEAREKWNDDDAVAQVIALGKLLGKNLEKPIEAVTPNQARGMGLDPELIKGFSHRPPGKLKLVPFDNKQTRKIFGANNP